MPEIVKMAEELEDQVQFSLIYIAEAHANDEWPVRSSRYHSSGVVDLKQPTTLLERVAVARAFVNEYLEEDSRIQVLVDDPEKGDPYLQAFSPWPLRFHVLGEDGTFTLIANPKSGMFDLSEIRNALV